jgi:hypothetical protein
MGKHVAHVCQTYKFHALSGAKLWTTEGSCLGSQGRTAALGPDGLFVRSIPLISPPPTNTILPNIHDPETGVGHEGFLSSTIPAVPPSGVGYFIHEGKLRAANPRSFAAPLWTFSGDTPLTLAPLLIDSTAFVAASSGKVYALDAASGAQRWQTTVAPAPSAPDDIYPGVLPGFGGGGGWVLMSGANALHAWKVEP